MLLVGLIAAFLVNRLLSKGAPADEDQDGGAKEIDQMFSEARRRLADSGIKVGKQPLILLLGAEGSAKTTLMEQCGVEAELLAGGVYRDEAILPTESVNVWFGDETAFVEAGGNLLRDQNRWSRLLRHLRPHRMAAVLGRRRQAPRAAVVCFPCDQLLHAGRSESVPAAARELRERLLEASTRLGIRLPVYVVFSKADRLPYFEDFVRGMPGAARQVLGATLPFRRDGQRTVYAEEESERLLDSYGAMSASLSLRRVELLSQQADDSNRAGIYEFPREFGKVRDLVVQFLVELCRPSQLSVSPFLRGFYFTGVRPVIIDDAAAVAPALDHPDDAAPVGATMIFDRDTLDTQAAAVAPGPGTRRVPEWVFVNRLFRSVFLDDEVAQGIAGGGSHVNFLRRGLLGAAIAVAGVLTLGTTVSFFQNRSLTRQVYEGMEGVGPLAAASSGSLSQIELNQLDALRAKLERLREYEEEGPPLKLRWGLYGGSQLLEPARDIYFAGYRPILHEPVWYPLSAYLERLPETPDASSDYLSTYSSLKAYLVMASYPDSSRHEFMVPVLESYWRGRHPDASEDTEIRGSVRKQFTFYADELPYGNPYSLYSDTSIVIGARRYLGNFQEASHFYPMMIAQASSQADAIRLERAVPDTRGLIRNEYEVPGGFTQPGWDFVRRRLDNVADLAGEEWVTGGRRPSPAELDTLAIRLGEMYEADYVGHWEQFLESASYEGFGSVRQAARSLEELSGNRSPLLQMFYLVSENTSVNSDTITNFFQPVHSVMPPDTSEESIRFVVESNATWITDLSRLQSSMERVADDPGSPDQELIESVNSDADRVEETANQISLGFEAGGRTVGQKVKGLLEAPAKSARRRVSGLAAGEVNGAGRAFCGSFNDLTSKYPFNPRASTDATLDEVDEIFKPGESALWTFYDDALADLVSREGSRYRERSGAPLSVDGTFLRFFNRAMRISEALYEGGAAPAVDLLIRLRTSELIPVLRIRIDTRDAEFRQDFSQETPFRWDAEGASAARITGFIGGEEEILVSAEGPWALFRVLQDADWDDQGGGRYVLVWDIPEHGAKFEGILRLSGNNPIFKAGFFDGLSCPQPVAR
jgi:type VI secretion system protein ImpL